MAISPRTSFIREGFLMNTKVNQETGQQTVLDRIESLLKGLTPDSLVVVEQFVRFVNEQARQGQPIVASAGEQQGNPPYKYPTIPVPASAFAKLDSIMPPVGGDALADSESLYEDN
jgi:hypothetical protein